MFVVLMKFGENRDRAGEFATEHVAWVKQGIADGVFLLAGSLQPGLGGAIVAHGIDSDALKARLADDPFVAEGVVGFEILEVAPSMADERVQFLVQG